jgi:hypothetical protein
MERSGNDSEFSPGDHVVSGQTLPLDNDRAR